MGLAIHVNAHLSEIDAERWEAVWLTSLQLLEQYPGALAAFRVVEHTAGRRALYSADYLCVVGKPEEHWPQANGERLRPAVCIRQCR